MKHAIFIFAIVAMAACSNPQNNSAASNTESSKPAATPAQSSSSATIGAATEMTLTLTGGANAGAYTATSGKATCSMGLTGEKSFGNQYSASDKGDNEFSSMQLIVDDYEAAKNGTDKFYIKVAFGKRLMGNKYEINGSDNSMAGKKQGNGTATITESGQQKIATIDGKTADGVTIHAVLTCGKTMKMVNGQLSE